MHALPKLWDREGMIHGSIRWRSFIQLDVCVWWRKSSVMCTSRPFPLAQNRFLFWQHLSHLYLWLKRDKKGSKSGRAVCFPHNTNTNRGRDVAINVCCSVYKSNIKLKDTDRFTLRKWTNMYKPYSDICERVFKMHEAGAQQPAPFTLLHMCSALSCEKGKTVMDL